MMKMQTLQNSENTMQISFKKIIMSEQKSQAQRLLSLSMKNTQYVAFLLVLIGVGLCNQSFPSFYRVRNREKIQSFSRIIQEGKPCYWLNLSMKVEKNYKNVEIGRTAFPSKRFFGSFNESTIQYRKSSLDSTKFFWCPYNLIGFLNILTETYKDEQLVEFLEFVEIKSKIIDFPLFKLSLERIEMLIRLPTVEAASCLIQDSNKTSNDVDQVTYYLTLFNRNPRDLCRSFR